MVHPPERFNEMALRAVKRNLYPSSSACRLCRDKLASCCFFWKKKKLKTGVSSFQGKKNGRPCFADPENSLKLKRLRVNRKCSTLRYLAKISLIGGWKKQRTDFEVKQKVVFLIHSRKCPIFSIGKTTFAKPPYRRVQKFIFPQKSTKTCLW